MPRLILVFGIQTVTSFKMSCCTRAKLGFKESAFHDIIALFMLSTIKIKRSRNICDAQKHVISRRNIVEDVSEYITLSVR